jgi:hypothetical protein
MRRRTLDKQIEYYTDILGLNLIAKEKGPAFLASTIDHHSVVLRKGDHSKCVRWLFRAAALAPRPAAEAESLGEKPDGVELLGYHADGRDAQVTAHDGGATKRSQQGRKP